MRQDLTIEEVFKDRLFGEDRIWTVRANGKRYGLYQDKRPNVGDYIPCDVVERKDTYQGRPVVYRDARPLIEHVRKAEAQEQAARGANPYQPEKHSLAAFLQAVPAILSVLPNWQNDVQHARAYVTFIDTCLMCYERGMPLGDLAGLPSKEVLDAYAEANGKDWGDVPNEN